MKQARCDRGHFYDADKYESCPHCVNVKQKSEDANVTITKPTGDIGITVTNVDGLSGGKGGVTEILTPPSYKPPMGGGSTTTDLDPITTGIYKKDGNPVVGWLVCTKGAHRGEDFRLRSGRNFIGRSSSIDICLSCEGTVSRNKHAVVLYEPHQRIFLAQMGESHELVYLNGELLLGSAQIKSKDRLQIGEAELMLIPCCDAEFDWSDCPTKE